MENLKENKLFFELGIYYDKKLKHYFEDEKTKLLDEFSNYHIVCSSCEDESYNIFLIAIDNEKKDHLINELTSFLKNIFIEYYKQNYLLNNLKNLEKLNEYKKLFLNVLKFFDLENDYLEIEKNLRFDKKLYLDAFYNFKLKNMEKKWKEICELTNDNSHFFDSENMIFELMRFLISNNKMLNDNAYVFFEYDKIMLKIDKKFEKTYNNKEKIEEIDFYCDILNNLPKTIYIDGNIISNTKLIENLKNIFKSKIKFCYKV